MHRVPVSSSNLSSVGYDESTGTLEIAFHKSGIYQYYHVPASVYEELMAAPSKGRYFSRTSKGVILTPKSLD